MLNPDLLQLSQNVLLISFGISLVVGWVLQKSNFCSMGSLSDMFLMGSFTRMRQWVFACAIAILGVGAMSSLGLILIQDTIYTSTKLLWASILFGSILFGFGMVLASGCGAKNITRFANGNLKSLIVLLVMGFFSQMTLRGIFGVIRVTTFDKLVIQLPTSQDLPHLISYWFNLDHEQLGPFIYVAFAGLMTVWSLSSKNFRSWKLIYPSVVIGAALIGLFYVSGHLGYIEENPATLEPLYLTTNSGKIEAMSLVAPMAYLLDYLEFFSDKSKTLTFGVVVLLGIFAGSFLTALFSKEFKWQGFYGVEDLANHLLGAALMGIGGVTAIGCTFGQGLSGFATLSLGSMIAVCGLVIGSYLALTYLQSKDL